MTTRGQVVDPDFITPRVATARAERAVVNRPSLTPHDPLAFWWGVAPGAMGGVGASAPATVTPASGSPTDKDRCCGA